MRVNGLTTRHMVMAPISMLMEQHTLETGLKINSMVKASKNGQMVPSMKETIRMERSMEMAASHLLMAVHILVNSRIMRYQV